MRKSGLAYVSCVVKNLFGSRELENVITPPWHIQVKAVGQQFIAVSLVNRRTHQISQLNRMAPQILAGNRDVALTLCCRIVCNHQEWQFSRNMPGETNEVVPCPVFIPGRKAIQQLPVAISDSWAMHAFEKVLVESTQGSIDTFVRAASQMDWQPLGSPL